MLFILMLFPYSSFFIDTATTEIYTLSLHDALPIWPMFVTALRRPSWIPRAPGNSLAIAQRSEEHTSELQSPCNLVCRLLLEKKKYSGAASSPLQSKRQQDI